MLVFFSLADVLLQTYILLKVQKIMPVVEIVSQSFLFKTFELLGESLCPKFVCALF